MPSVDCTCSSSSLAFPVASPGSNARSLGITSSPTGSRSRVLVTRNVRLDSSAARCLEPRQSLLQGSVFRPSSKRLQHEVFGKIKLQIMPHREASQQMDQVRIVWGRIDQLLQTSNVGQILLLALSVSPSSL